VHQRVVDVKQVFEEQAIYVPELRRDVGNGAPCCCVRVLPLQQSGTYYSGCRFSCLSGVCLV
jgi:hypothetical protein